LSGEDEGGGLCDGGGVVEEEFLGAVFAEEYFVGAGLGGEEVEGAAGDEGEGAEGGGGEGGLAGVAHDVDEADLGLGGGEVGVGLG
jgi:hypothetical protein